MSKDFRGAMSKDFRGAHMLQKILILYRNSEQCHYLHNVQIHTGTVLPIPSIYVVEILPSDKLSDIL